MELVELLDDRLVEWLVYQMVIMKDKSWLVNHLVEEVELVFSLVVELGVLLVQGLVHRKVLPLLVARLVLPLVPRLVAWLV